MIQRLAINDVKKYEKRNFPGGGALHASKVNINNTKASEW